MGITSHARRVRLDYQRQIGRNVTISEVSEATGVSRWTLTRIERGDTAGIDFDTLARLCKFYGVPVGDLLEYEESQSPELVAA